MKWALGLLGVGALILLALLDLAGQVPGNADDAFILLVYARHFAENGGLYYNQADGALDGFSSLLDVVLKGLAIRLSGADPVRVNFWVCTVAYCTAVAGAVVVAFRACSGADSGARSGAGRRAGLAALGAVALAFTPGLAEGTSYLLETPVFAALLLAGLACIVGERVALGPLALVALGWVAVRPEGTPLALYLLTAAALQRPPSERAGALRLLALFCGLLIAYYAWRIWLFGHWAPNSYYAKTSARRAAELRDGWNYLWAHGGTFAGGLLSVAIVLGPLYLRASGWSSPSARGRYGLLSGAALLALAVVLVSGGDCYAGARLLMPPFLIGITALCHGLAHTRGRARWYPCSILVLVAGTGVVRALQDAGPKLRSLSQGALDETHFACSADVSARLAAAHPGARLAQVHFQRYKYFQDDAQVFDLTGINQREVAHEPVEAPVAFGKDGLARALGAGIEVLHLDYRWSHPLPMARHTTAALLANPQLRETFAVLVQAELADELSQLYTPASLVGVCGSQCFNVFVRRDVAQQFAAAGFMVQRD